MLFIEGVVSIFYRVDLFCVPLILYFLLFSIAYVFCQPFDRIVFVNTWQKGGEIDEMWKSCLFCLGGVKIVFERGRKLKGSYIYCFICFLFHCLLIYIHDVIHWYMSLFCVLWNQEFILFTCIFHTCIYASCLVFQEKYRLIQLSCLIELLSTLAINGQ